MVIGGEWALFDDGVIRPVIHGDIFLGDDFWLSVPFLVDTGADKSVFSAAVLPKLNLPLLQPQTGVSGVGGKVNTIHVKTKIRLSQENNQEAVFNGTFDVLTELDALDFCVLGRDVLGHFAVIVDFPILANG